MTDRIPSSPQPPPPDRPQSASGSINFVITAIYTVTFANAIYRVAHAADKPVTISIRDDAGTTALVCAGMCMVMALRFFFGNNNFMDSVFSSPEGPWRRLYHFAVTTAQSLVLLGSSYLVTNPREFIWWLAALFAVEVGWYIGCLAWSHVSVYDSHGRLQGTLLQNELANAGVAMTALVGLFVFAHHDETLVWVVFGVFLLNTVVDIRHNLRGYMGL